MPRELSSAQTFFLKVVFPVVWIGFFGIGTVSLFTGCRVVDESGAPLSPEMKWVFVLIWGVGTAFLYWACGRLKRVRMDGTALYISNYWREATVPLRQVVAVTENRWVNLHPVTIEFRSATEFGDRIVFMPKARVFNLWTSHPVVAEIRRAVAGATGLRATGSS